MQIQKLKTSKLFYNKWPYKIECRLHKIHYIVRLGFKRTQAWIDGDNQDNFIWRDADKKEIASFMKSFQPFVGKDLQIRAEGSRFNIFVKDKDLFGQLTKSMNKWIQRISEPGNDEEYDFLMTSSSKKVICNDLPKGKYRYKIFLRSKMNVDTRQKFQEWTKKYGEKFSIANSTNKWLSGSVGWVQDPFFYVDDDRMLSMTGLYLGNFVKRVEEFIPRNKINI